MQKAQTRDGNQLLDEEKPLPNTHFPAAFPELLNVRQRRQTGQLNFYKLLELSRELHTSSAVRCGRQSSGSYKHSVDGACHAGPAVHPRLLGSSRSQQVHRNLQDLCKAKHVSDKLSCQAACVQPLPACPLATQTALATASASRQERGQPARHTEMLSRTTEPAPKRSCRLHTAPSMTTTSVTAERSTAYKSATLTVLPAQHPKRFPAADPCSAGHCTGHPRSIAKLPLQCTDTVMHPFQSGSAQPVQRTSSALQTTAPALEVPAKLQPVQLQPSATPSQPSMMLTSATLHKHDASEQTPRPEARDPSHASDEEMGSEDSVSDTFFTDTRGTRPRGCFSPSLGCFGVDGDDCLSVGTSQAITDGSSSMGDAEAAAGTGGVSQGRAGPLMACSVMGTAPTVAFVGLHPSQDAEPALAPLRYTCLCPVS